MARDVSLIIPSKDNEKNILKLVLGIMSWKEVPNEIIVIDSSKKKIEFPEELEIFLDEHNIKLEVIHGETFYPGHARNIGIKKSENSLIAFLDASTHPTDSWLSCCLEIIDLKDCEGVWGNTYYLANTYLKKIFRACSFGSAPVQTLPGSVFKKDIFNKCGLFIQGSRAGEDGDWMCRVRLHEINMARSDELLSYDELNNYSIKDLLKKWFRNYTHAARLPYFKAQKDFYYYTISFTTILLAFNWNRVITSWDSNNIFYIPNITTGIILLLGFCYILIRGIALPLKKGVKLSFILPINFLLITVMSALLDLTKAIAFGYSRLINK
jgi:glycosyltransferase involved in cell wall biosynthesis